MHKKCKTTRKYKYRYHSKSGERLRAVALVEDKTKRQKYNIRDLRGAGGKEQIQNANNIKHR